MKPICATVDQASRTLMLMRVSITMPASSAVARPMPTSSQRASGAASSSGAKRISTKPPRLTTPACSSADTGVGASITWISQPCTGNRAMRSTTASTRQTALACKAGEEPSASRWRQSADSEPEPTSFQASAAAAISSRSARRSARRFLCAASSAKGRSR